MFTKVFITLAVVAAFLVTLKAQSVRGEEADCPQVCPLLYAPVCGTNGKDFMEFSNPCEMKFRNCQLQKTIEKPMMATDLDWCRTELVHTMDGLLVKLGNLNIHKSECFKPCPRIFSPVCISNGKYRTQLSNYCLLPTLNCMLGNQKKFKILRNGSC